jgi:hypothetical protein
MPGHPTPTSATPSCNGLALLRFGPASIRVSRAAGHEGLHRGREPEVSDMQGGNEGMVKCQHCDQSFATQQELDDHMQQQHADKMPMGDSNS